MPDRTGDLTLAAVLDGRPALTRTLAAGMAGLDVARLQADLRRVVGAPGIDGIFGERTAAAVLEARGDLALPGDATVDAALWAALGRKLAELRVAAAEDHARALEQLATDAAKTAADAQQLARDRRAQAAPAGDDEERAALALLQSARHWQAAAAAYLAAARLAAADALPERDWPLYARHLRALDQVRVHAGRARASLALAGADFAADPAARARLAAASADVRPLELG